jgi:hypothetical protein
MWQHYQRRILHLSNPPLYSTTTVVFSKIDIRCSGYLRLAVALAKLRFPYPPRKPLRKPDRKRTCIRNIMEMQFGEFLPLNHPQNQTRGVQSIWSWASKPIEAQSLWGNESGCTGVKSMTVNIWPLTELSCLSLRFSFRPSLNFQPI